MTQKKWLILGGILVVALLVRFYYFKSNIYFGFDEARDALVSENIYLKGDIKLIGPPASGQTGLFHGPAFWYLVGPLYLLFQGNIYLMAAVFRLINVLGIFLIFAIGRKLFSDKVGLLAAFLYAISFEQSQYAMYISKESLSVIYWIVIMLMTISIYKKEKFGLQKGLSIIAFCYGLMLQANIIYAGFALGLIVLGILLSDDLRLTTVKSRLAAIFVFGLTISTYILEEIVYNFREIKAAVNLIRGGYGIMVPGETKFSLFVSKYLTMFKDNLVGLPLDINLQKMVVAGVAIFFTLWLLLKAVKDRKFALLLVWLMTFGGILLAGGHMAYYTNVGISGAILLGTAVLLEKLESKKIIFGLLTAIILAGNLYLIYDRREKGLIVAIKPQPYMNLVDERRVIDHMYGIADGRGFTVRLTGIPYKVQTVWYYLLREYGYEKYGYYPYWEHGNVSAFPGELPTPGNGSTCLRFLVREPNRGLPIDLVNEDTKQENYFSKVKDMRAFGYFTLEERYDPGIECHNNRP